MKKIIEKIIEKYDALIEELEQINLDNKQYLQDAEDSKNFPLNEFEERMQFARDNKKRLKFAIAERDNLKEYLNRLKLSE